MILMTEMVVRGDSYEKWSRAYNEILRVVDVILITEIVLVDDSYEKSCCKWSSNYSGTTDWSMGNHHGDPRGDSKDNIYDSYDRNDSVR